MNSIYRNFIITLKVNKMAVTLNICGLVIAFTLFDSVAIRTESERTFDKIHSKAEAIYRLDCVTSKSQWPTQILPFAQAFASSSPHILESTIINPYVGEVYFSFFSVRLPWTSASARKSERKNNNSSQKPTHTESLWWFVEADRIKIFLWRSHREPERTG